jgi:hypothetical protein
MALSNPCGGTFPCRVYLRDASSRRIVGCVERLTCVFVWRGSRKRLSRHTCTPRSWYVVRLEGEEAASELRSEQFFLSVRLGVTSWVKHLHLHSEISCNDNVLYFLVAFGLLSLLLAFLCASGPLFRFRAFLRRHVRSRNRSRR